MANGFGIALGGAAQQISDISRRQISERAVGLQERALEFQMRTQQQQQVAATSAELIKGLIDRKKAFAGSSQEFNQMIRGSLQGSVQMLETLTQNARANNLDVPDLAQQLVIGLENTPTAGEAAVSSGRVQATEQVARAGGLAELGIPEAQALAAVGIPQADIPKVQSDIGKLIQDQQIISERFGEDSPQAQAIAEAIQSKGAGEAPSISDVSGLRKEFTKASAPFIGIRDAFDRVKFAAENPTPAGDVALIFAFMKMLDPNSTVREGEFATAQNAGGVPDRVMALYNRAIDGTRLSDDVRNDFFNQSKGIFLRGLQRQVEREGEFSRLAEEGRFPVGQVILDFKGDVTPEDVRFASTPETAPGQAQDQNPDEAILSKPLDSITRDEVRQLSPEGRQRLRERLERGN